MGGQVPTTTATHSFSSGSWHPALPEGRSPARRPASLPSFDHPRDLAVADHVHLVHFDRNHPRFAKLLTGCSHFVLRALSLLSQQRTAATYQRHTHRNQFPQGRHSTS